MHVPAEHDGHVGRQVARPHDVVAVPEREAGRGPAGGALDALVEAEDARVRLRLAVARWRRAGRGTPAARRARRGSRRTPRAARAARSRPWTARGTRAGARCAARSGKGIAERSWLPGTSRTGTPASATRSRGCSARWTSEAGTRLRYSRSPPWTTTSASPRSAGSSARSKHAKKSGPRRRRSTRGRAGRSKPRWVSETNSTRIVAPALTGSHPPQHRPQPAPGQPRVGPQPQLDGSPAPAASPRSSVVSTRSRSKVATSKAARRSASVRACPGGTGTGAPGSRSARAATAPPSITSSRRLVRPRLRPREGALAEPDEPARRAAPRGRRGRPSPPGPAPPAPRPRPRAPAWALRRPARPAVRPGRRRGAVGAPTAARRAGGARACPPPARAPRTNRASPSAKHVRPRRPGGLDPDGAGAQRRAGPARRRRGRRAGPRAPRRTAGETSGPTACSGSGPLPQLAEVRRREPDRPPVRRQGDVEGRGESLDLVRLQQRRLERGLGLGAGHVAGLREHLQRALAPAGVEVAAHALAQRGGLADVEHGAARAQQPVDARAVRQLEAALARQRKAARGAAGRPGQPLAQLVEVDDALALGEQRDQVAPHERGGGHVVGAAPQGRHRRPEVAGQRAQRAAGQLREQPAGDRVRADEVEGERPLPVALVQRAQERLLEAGEVDDGGRRPAARRCSGRRPPAGPPRRGPARSRAPTPRCAGR